MRSTSNSPLLPHHWEELTHTKLDPTQLDKIKVQLDLVLLALEALARVDTNVIIQAAAHLNLEPQVLAYITSRQPQLSDSLPESEASQPQRDEEAVRSLVLTICYLSRQHQELIRRAVTLLEQLVVDRRSPHDIALLGDYLDTFNQLYQERWLDEDKIATSDLLNSVALKLLVELLFYSGPGGHHRLWSRLLKGAPE
ncbi:MAG: DUF3038 domain-containing protein [Chroococcidiopsidaceae cyanobacterium CP_BM_ER_R8_30]|nr:DUF3038 domain-containing protein [Chroococcidiopsidaceae cyanobacterium CP_BM_ER_R8_30]